MSDNNLYERITEIFHQFGISEATTKVYLTSIKLGKAKASQIAEHLNIDRTEAYHLLKKLQKLDLVEESLENPVLYNPKNPIPVIETFIEREEYRLKSVKLIESSLLEDIKNLNFENEDSKNVGKYIILRGRPRIFSFMKDEILRSKTSVRTLMTVNDSIRRFHNGGIFELMSEKCRQGVDIKIIAEIGKKNNSVLSQFSKIAELRYLKRVPIDLTIYDGCSVSLPLLNTNSLKMHENLHVAIWTNSRFFANGMGDLFNFLWSTAKVR